MIVGLGEYTGTVEKSFVVKTGKAAMTAELKDKNKGYPSHSAGMTISSNLVVKDTALNNAVLKQGKDHKVTYSNNKKVNNDKSQAKYTVTFLGNYKGSKAALLSNATAGLKIVVADKSYKNPGLYKSAPYVTINSVMLKSSDYKAEVRYMSIFEYDEEETRRAMRKTEYERGMAEGMAKGKSESILFLLEELGTVPEALRRNILDQCDPAVLRRWLKTAAEAESIASFTRQAGL